MLGVIAFLVICLIAALFPTLVAVAILGTVCVMAAFHLRDKYGRK